jgi:hypothetical protein
MKTSAFFDSRIETPPDSQTLQIHDSLPVSDLSWNSQKVCEQKSESAITFTYYQKVSMMYEFHQDFFRMLPSRETEHPSLKVTYEFIHEFGRSEFRGCKVFAQFPNKK